MMRLAARAVCRARLPVKFSEGFNPHPRLRLLLPRPVGVASECELLVLDLTGEVSDPHWGEGLLRQFPPGAEFRGVEPLSEGPLPRVTWAAYAVALTAEEVPRVRARLVESDEAFVPRDGATRPAGATHPEGAGGHPREVRLEGDTLRFVTPNREGGLPRLGDVLAGLGLGTTDAAPEPHGRGRRRPVAPEVFARVVRTALGLDRGDGSPATTKGTLTV